MCSSTFRRWAASSTRQWWPAKCDGAILVISDHQVRCHQAVEVVDQLKKCGSRILGVVRNNIHASSSGYYKKYYKNRYQ